MVSNLTVFAEIEAFNLFFLSNAPAEDSFDDTTNYQGKDEAGQTVGDNTDGLSSDAVVSTKASSEGTEDTAQLSEQKAHQLGRRF